MNHPETIGREYLEPVESCRGGSAAVIDIGGQYWSRVNAGQGFIEYRDLPQGP